MKMRIEGREDIKSGRRRISRSALRALCVATTVLAGTRLANAQPAPPARRALDVLGAQPRASGSQVLDASPGARWQTLDPPPQSLNVGQSLRTGTMTRVTLSTLTRRTLEMAPETEIEIRDLDKAELTLYVVGGSLYSHHTSGPLKEPQLVLKSKSGRAVIKGTEWELQVDDVTGETTLKVLAGEVELSSTAPSCTGAPGATVNGEPCSVTVHANVQATVAPGGPPRIDTKILTVTPDRVHVRQATLAGQHRKFRSY